MPVNSNLNALAASSLADFTRPQLVVPSLRERDAAGIISELSHVLQDQGIVPDVLPFYHAALNQELLANSALQSGIAFPHARLSSVRQLQFALGRAPSPIVWGPKSSWPVQLVFLIAVPATDGAAYLQLLAALARLGRQPEILAELRRAQTVDGLIAGLEKLRVRPA